MAPRKKIIQPWDTNVRVGPTAYGQYEGPVTIEYTPWERRFQPEIPTSREMRAAVRRASRGRRIGDRVDTTLAELTAILTYMQRIAMQPDAANRRVLILSDCLNGLRAIEETWRGKGPSYRQRAGGATIEAINELRSQIERVTFIYVPSHAGVVPNAYVDGIAKAYLGEDSI